MAESGPLFVVAIDFGTTYSGYAYSTKNDFQTDPSRVWANQNWNAGGQGLSKKTPTCLLLNEDKEFHAFGYEAEEEYATLTAKNEHDKWYYFRRFKMKLHGEKDIGDDMVIEDEIGKPLPALLVFSRSIAYLKGHFEEQLDTRGIDVTEDEIDWVLTVPAIWSDNAKSFMRKAAVKAGIRSKQLKIALEPEAASLFCQHEKTECGGETGFSAAGPGTKYMVIDLGGGTADITVHEKLPKGAVKEIYKASGGVWGGTVVDEAYIQLLTKIVGGPAVQRFRKESMEDYLDMMREFEITKRSIKPKGRSIINFKIPAILNHICRKLNGETIKSITASQNFPFNEAIKVTGDKLQVDVEIVKGIFGKVTDQIVKHIEDILKDKFASEVSLMIFVGGFSESPLVQDTMKNKFKTRERKVIVPQDPGLSVVKGAVIFGHNPCTIQLRILRFTYGSSVKSTFDPEKHPESRKYVLRGKEKINIFVPFIRAGTTVDIGYTVSRNSYYDTENFKNTYSCVFASSNPDARYVDDPACRLVKKIHVGRLLPPLQTKPDEQRECTFDYIFGDTEVEFILKEKATGFKYNDKFELQE